MLREGGPAELLLPYPGDMRGLPLGGELTVAALDAGAVVVLPDSSIALVPADGQWRAFPCTTRHPALGLGEAHEMLDAAVGRATRSLTALDVARGSDTAREQVRRVMLDEAMSSPPGTPSAASALLATSISLHALLAVASSQDTAAVTSYEMAAVDDVLRPLAIAIRESRRAAVAAAVRVLSRAPGRLDALGRHVAGAPVPTLVRRPGTPLLIVRRSGCLISFAEKPRAWKPPSTITIDPLVAGNRSDSSATAARATGVGSEVSQPSGARSVQAFSRSPKPGIDLAAMVRIGPAQPD